MSPVLRGRSVHTSKTEASAQGGTQPLLSGHSPNFIGNFSIKKASIWRLECKLRHTLKELYMVPASHSPTWTPINH